MRIGAHESVAGGISKAFARAQEHGATSLAVFTKSSRAWQAPALSEEEAKLFRREAKRTQLPAIAHGSYLVNLASEELALRERSIDCLFDELERCERLGIPSLVIHPGVHADVKRGTALIAEALDELHARTPKYKAQIVLEGTAGQGNSIGWRFEHLAMILEQVRRPARVGICLDSCHLYAAGYDLSSIRSYEKVIKEFDRLVGVERVRCFHLNDCKKPLGCRVDRHEEIGKGTLGLTAFRCLVNDSRFADTPAVLETPFVERYSQGIRLLQSLVDQ
jgi:deoxyribonuclease-4